MNNNRNNNNNNRRRGRGNGNGNGSNRPNGGGQQINRIDSRARGNAPQMLEKYRKMALDSHMNGDRVNEEYYLQFADHYFRVIADTRVRQEESRQRRDDRWQDGGDSAGSGGNDREYGEYPGEESGDVYDDMRQGVDRYERQERPERQERSERQERPERQERADRAEQRQVRPERHGPARRIQNDGAAAAGTESGVGQTDAVEAAESVYEPSSNPFVREGRDGRGLRQRRAPRPPRAAVAPDAAASSVAVEDRAGLAADDADGQADGERAQEPAQDLIDPATLPPAVSARRGTAPAGSHEAGTHEAGDDEIGGADEAAEVKPRRRTRRARPAADGTGESLETVN